MAGSLLWRAIIRADDRFPYFAGDTVFPFTLNAPSSLYPTTQSDRPLAPGFA